MKYKIHIKADDAIKSLDVEVDDARGSPWTEGYFAEHIPPGYHLVAFEHPSDFEHVRLSRPLKPWRKRAHRGL
jgi:hypothetical protein